MLINLYRAAVSPTYVYIYPSNPCSSTRQWDTKMKAKGLRTAAVWELSSEVDIRLLKKLLWLGLIPSNPLSIPP